MSVKFHEALRTCNFCGFEALMEPDLELFRRAERSKYGRANTCKKCYREQRRNNGKYYDVELQQKKSYNQTDNGKNIAIKTFYNWKENNIDKYKAQYLARIHTELDASCSVCGSTERLERHHPDYSQPLKIVALCVQCHKDLHRRIGYVS